MEWLKRFANWFKSKTVIGAVVLIFGPMVQEYLGFDSAQLTELLQAIGAIIAVIGARDAVSKIGQ